MVVLLERLVVVEFCDEEDECWFSSDEEGDDVGEVEGEEEGLELWLDGRGLGIVAGRVVV